MENVYYWLVDVRSPHEYLYANLFSIRENKFVSLKPTMLNVESHARLSTYMILSKLVLLVSKEGIMILYLLLC